MKSCISNIFFDYGDAHLTLFLKLRNFLNNRKSLMTLMTVTLMTGKASKHSFVFLMKLLSVFQMEKSIKLVTRFFVVVFVVARPHLRLL